MGGGVMDPPGQLMPFLKRFVCSVISYPPSVDNIRRYWALPHEAPEVRHVPRRCLHGRPLPTRYTRIARAPMIRCGTDHALIMRRVRIALFGLLVAGKGMHSFCTGDATLDPECTSL